ncbi:hypothetical protein BGZ83_003494, partial [Gryganskiella cystojenkinii]
TCEQNFDPACAYDGKTVYDCSGIGSTPKIKKECETGCYTYGKTGGCTGGQCACWKKGDTCGYTFPLYCNLENHTRYDCEEEGERPVNSRQKYCDAQQSCVTFGVGDNDCADTNTCDSNVNEPVCSQEFQPECIRDTKNINGTVDTFNYTFQVQVNPTGTFEACEVGCSDGVCQTCKCTAPGIRCGYLVSSSLKSRIQPVVLVCWDNVEPEYETNCKNEVCGKGFNKTAEDGSTVSGPLNDTCLDV